LNGYRALGINGAYNQRTVGAGSTGNHGAESNEHEEGGDEDKQRLSSAFAQQPYSID